MKKLITMALALICVVMMIQSAAFALNAEPASLTVVMEDVGKPISGMKIAVCRVADMKEENGGLVFEATPSFAGVGADFTDLTKEKNIALAANLNTYASANNVTREVKTTGANGKATYTDLTPGLYLVAQTDAQSSQYTIAPYLVAVPIPNANNEGEWEYDVTAYPKTEPVKRDSDTISVSVYKIWSGTTNPPGSILVQLYRNGSPYGYAVTLNAGNYWGYEWENLNANDTWTVDEFNVPPGYAKKIEGSAATGFIITNTKTTTAPEKIILGGTKTWNHGSNPISQRPKSIVLTIKANGISLIKLQIDESKHWSWDVWLDKYDANGKEIVYTVDEDPVYNYSKKITGYSIHNSYIPGDPVDPGNPSKPQTPDGPKTSDDSNRTLWISLIAGGVIGLAAILTVALAGRRKKRDEIIF